MLLLAPGNAAARKPIIAVFTITADGVNSLRRQTLDRLTTYFSAQLTASGAYQVVPRDQLVQRLREQRKTSYKKCYDQSCQIAIGQELAANKSLSTRVMKLAGLCIMTATIYDLKTSTTEKAATAKGKCNEAGLVQSLDAVVKDLTGSGGGGSEGGEGGENQGPGPAGDGGTGGISWPPACPTNRPKKCLEKAQTLTEGDQALIMAAWAHVQATKISKWKVARAALQHIKKLVQGYVPRQTQLEDLLKKKCNRRMGGACLALAKLKDIERIHEDHRRYLKLGCDAGHLAACVDLGKVHKEGGGGATKNIGRAMGLFRRACDRGFWPGCAELAKLHRYGVDGSHKDLRKAEGLYRRACDRNYYPACHELGLMFAFGDAKDYGKSVALYRRGCDSGHAKSCSSLAYMYREGRGVAKNESKAIAIYRKACGDGYVFACTAAGDYTRAAEIRRGKCDRGDLFACNSLAYMYKSGKGVPLDMTKATAIYRRSCNLGNIDACSAIKDDVRVVQLYKQGCDGGNKYNCNALGDRYRYGRGVTTDKFQAVQYYRKACDGGYAYGCNNLAYMYRWGYGVAKDENKATAIYRRSCEKGDIAGCRGAKMYGKIIADYRKRCDGGSMYSCASLAEMYRDGTGVTKNGYTAAGLFRKACNGSNMSACYQLAVLHQNGTGVTKNTTTAMTFFRKACDGGYRSACSYANPCASGYYRNSFGRCVRSSTATTKRYLEYMQACTRGDMSKCNSLALAYSYGTSGAYKSKSLAANYYRKACDGNYMQACSNLAYLYKMGQGVTTNVATARLYYEKACRGGYSYACNYAKSLGGSSSGAVSFSSSPSSGKKYLEYDRNCNRFRNMQDCNRLGLAYSFGGSGASKSKILAAKYYRKACDGGFMQGCSNLGFLYKNGQGVAKSVSQASYYWSKACRGGYSSACSYAGKYGGSSGANIRRTSYTPSKPYLGYMRACSSGNMNECNRLGMAYSFGTSGAFKSKSLAATYYRKACNGNHAVACSNLGYFYKIGTGVARNASLSRFYYQKACRLGHTYSCRQAR